MSIDPGLPPEAYVVALASLPEAGPARLHALLDGRQPERAWEQVLTGGWLTDACAARTVGAGAAQLAERWQAAARGLDVAGQWRKHEATGVSVVAGPALLRRPPWCDDPEPPAALFLVGDPCVLDRPRVAVVGTRRCTEYGRRTAFGLGRALAGHGVAVVSGLALGIDGAAHAGAIDAGAGPPVAVVGTGVDVVYPRQQRQLWRAVVARGVLLSEAPLGTPPRRWRFPARNRLIAALADVVVVVESPERGGSMHTVTEALRRDRPVLAVPGPVGSPASNGTNRLLRDGAAPACDLGDVLTALELAPTARTEGRLVERRRTVLGALGTEPEPGDPIQAAVLDALGWEGATLDDVAARTGAAVGQLALTIQHMEYAGLIAHRDGWYERKGTN